ncbi:MAG: bifunctional pyr operon transcriptional regulator/uracil phosphoribosyltransferase PyrR [Massilioclostridium sp.]|nr:bifunctional pyr operon transcriptional regulator/uracil phosphoribosyltransferase PyrR [Massilioclostridium sp.]MEE1491669.1 bifunctional pyr operon transcriptional regulator/uracil phosphoribosyltransferase PyrR [Massilioclostridium sp.]
MTEKAIILDDKAMARAIARMSYQIIERNKGVDNLVIIGILSRGAQIAERIARRIQEVEGKTVEVGLLDITAHRDDLHTGADYQDKSSIPFDFNDKTVVLVDDVMYTGRSVRAAIDGLMDRGRPRSIQLAVLIDRGHRELPIRPDYIGKNVPTSKNEQIQVFVTERDGIDKVSIL